MKVLERRDLIGWGVIGVFLFAFLGYFLFDLSGDQNESTQSPKELVSESAGVRQENQTVAEIQESNPEVLDLIQKVSNHMLLPDGEVVTAEVVDPEASRAKSPIFYRYAKKGDKVLIYPDRAILYSPSSDRIVDILHLISQ